MVGVGLERAVVAAIRHAIFVAVTGIDGVVGVARVIGIGLVLRWVSVVFRNPIVVEVFATLAGGQHVLAAVAQSVFVAVGIVWVRERSASDRRAVGVHTRLGAVKEAIVIAVGVAVIGVRDSVLVSIGEAVAVAVVVADVACAIAI